jgi:hypothetical protein
VEEAVGEEEVEVVLRVKAEEHLDLEKVEKRPKSQSKFLFLLLYYNQKCQHILWFHKK